jgi:hypothetical protein
MVSIDTPRKLINSSGFTAIATNRKDWRVIRVERSFVGRVCSCFLCANPASAAMVLAQTQTARTAKLCRRVARVSFTDQGNTETTNSALLKHSQFTLLAPSSKELRGVEGP